MLDKNDKTSLTDDQARNQIPDSSEPLPTDNRALSSQPSDASLEDLPTSPKDPSQPGADSVTDESSRWNAPSSICLCQPDPKVPRPRNAFILYRQHHQAHVVAQNPGLANPEISKVIGDHWRQSAPEVKAHWKNLAEEEKIRHQRQYPDYRYQPRRNGRNNSISSGSNPSTNSLDSENRRCPKCGGRSMNTPSTIISAGIPTSASPAIPGTPYSANRPPSTPSTGSSAKKFLQGAGSPPLTNSGNGFLHRNRDLSNNITALGLATPRFRKVEDADFPISPDTKRRRVAGAHYMGPLRMANGPATPFAFPRRRESLPRPDFMNSPTFAMGPPPRPHPVAHPPDSSLTLPPLQNTALHGHSTQAKSVEAMVMSIPTLNKIRILSKISPPLANPSPASPAFATRGFIISIDGQEAAAIEQMTAYLNTVFTPSHSVKVFQPPSIVEDSTESETGKSEEQSTSSIESCHLSMAKYSTLSAQLKSYITSSLEASASAASSPAVSPKSVPARTRLAMREQGGPTASTPSSTLAEPASASSIDTGGRKGSLTDRLLPVALVPSYQLTQTDASACRIPIDDNYAPTDHWQWMASMWRGIVGPDITIVVKAHDEAAPLEQKGRRNNVVNVDVRLEDSRAVVVRVEKGGKIVEGSLRRVGFEVGEWMRGRGGIQ
ncbi:MAG: hypothetical protein L6R41_004197 [Letrouitia leprolyta]|nr:MAG: hypothetical protein L6R41_004197 [Letrouitia leprolyta]